MLLKLRYLILLLKISINVTSAISTPFSIASKEDFFCKQDNIFVFSVLLSKPLFPARNGNT